jgi:hypothetical protein
MSMLRRGATYAIAAPNARSFTERDHGLAHNDRNCEHFLTIEPLIFRLWTIYAICAIPTYLGRMLTGAQIDK